MSAPKVVITTTFSACSHEHDNHLPSVNSMRSLYTETIARWPPHDSNESPCRIPRSLIRGQIQYTFDLWLCHLYDTQPCWIYNVSLGFWEWFCCLLFCGCHIIIIVLCRSIWFIYPYHLVLLHWLWWNCVSTCTWCLRPLSLTLFDLNPSIDK